MEIEIGVESVDAQEFVAQLVREDLPAAKDLFYRLAVELSGADIADVMTWPLIDPKQGATLEGKICDND